MANVLSPRFTSSYSSRQIPRPLQIGVTTKLSPGLLGRLVFQ